MVSSVAEAYTAPSTTAAAANTIPRFSMDVINNALKTHAAKGAEYKLFIDYYEGRHNLAFATVKWRNTFGSLFRQFADNLCAPIVDAAADRLKVTGFSVPKERVAPEGIPSTSGAGTPTPPSDDPASDTPTSTSSTAELLKEIWDYNNMDRKSGTVHEHVLKAGDAYIIVWPDADGEPILSPNPAHQVCCYYADDGETIEYASKLWQLDNGQWRLNLYYPYQIEKYITTSSIKGIPQKAQAFRSYVEPGIMWPMPNPYGVVPVFHFANKPEMGVWGQSELWNIISLQDGLNKSVADMLVAMEFVSLPQRWATGLEVPEDPVTGKPIPPFEAGVDRIWANPDPDGRFGAFEPANLSNFSQVQNDFRLDMARISRTPLHYLSMGGSSQSAFVSVAYPSGEALKTAEAPFISKLEDRQTTYGDVWEAVMAFAALIKGIKIKATDILTEWLPSAPRSESDELENAQTKLAVGIPQEIIWKELGYTDIQIANMKAIKQKEAEQNLAQAQALAAANPSPPGNRTTNSESNQQARS